jgi:hypothetical protein
VTPDVTAISQVLLGPFGGMLALLAVGVAVLRGDLRLPREVRELEAQLTRERQEHERWEGIAMRQMSATDRAIHVAQSAAAVAHTAAERRP